MMYNETNLGRKYDAPCVDVVKMDSEQVLCASGEGANTVPEFFYEEW